MKNKPKKNKKTEIYFQNSFEIKKNPKGDVYKILSNKSKIYKGFGELYITNLKTGRSKGWNYHKRMTLHLFVIKGRVSFFFKKNNKLMKKTLSENKNEFLTIKPKVWIKMVNLIGEKSKIINFANLKYSQNEIIKKEI